MNNYKLLCGLLAGILLFTISCDKDELQNKNPASVHCIGSSFTANYYQMLRKIIVYNGDSIYADASTIGGGTLQMHTESNTMETIRNTGFELTIIQESGNFASLNDSLIEARTVPYLVMLIDSIKHYNPNARIALYMSHAYEYGNIYNCEYDSTICTFEGMQNRIITNNIKLSKRFDLELIPVGYYCVKFSELYPEIDMFLSDKVHQTKTGVYLTTCIIYSSIYKKSLLGAPKLYGLSDENAALVQEFVANEVMNDSEWNNYY